MSLLSLAAAFIVAICATCSPTSGADGQDGRSSVVETADEPAGDNCPNGGTVVRAGIDDDGDEALDTEEIETVSYICSGTDGDDGDDGVIGADGEDGLTSLVSVVVEAAGVNCADGGYRVTHGVDDDDDGTLDDGEVDGTSYVCNGGDGTNGTPGLRSLVVLTAEPAGANCAAGGQRIDHGLDDNGNGVLDGNEIDGTAYVCNGRDGRGGAPDLEGVFAQYESEGRNVYLWQTPPCATLADFTTFCEDRGLAWWSPRSQPDAQQLVTFAYDLDLTHTWIQIYGAVTTELGGTINGYAVTLDGAGCVEGSNSGWSAFRRWACSLCDPESNAQQQNDGQSCCWDKGHPYDWFVCED